MRILTITNWYPPHHRGGYEINCADVMNRLAARGHRVEVLCGNQRLPNVQDAEQPVPVHRDLQMYWRDEAPWTPGPRGQLEIERANQAALRRIVEDLCPDVVSVWHLAAFSLNLLTAVHRRGLPIVYSIGDAWPSYTMTMDPWARRFDRRVGRPIGRLLESMVGVPVVVPDLGSIGLACFTTRFVEEDIRQNGRWRFPRSRIIPAGIDRGVLDGRGAAGSAQRDWAWKLAYFGRFDVRKGVDTLIRSIAELPEASLAMYGRGGEQERDRLASLAARLGVGERVSFGSLDTHELGAAYRASDCVVFPSEWPEPFGMVPLEAMECGTPVVATGTGGSSDFLSHEENCLIFRAGDSAALAAQVRRLAADPALRERLRSAGYRTAQKFDVDLIADTYEHCFEDVVMGGAGTG